MFRAVEENDTDKVAELLQGDTAWTPGTNCNYLSRRALELENSKMAKLMVAHDTVQTRYDKDAIQKAIDDERFELAIFMLAFEGNWLHHCGRDDVDWAKERGLTGTAEQLQADERFEYT